MTNPANFRRHPGEQLDALRGSMRTIGWIKTVIVNVTTSHVLDGHARIGRFTVDFVIADRIVVEADGDYWHAKPEVAAKDRRKDAWLSGRGYKIIHVSEKEILSSVDKIVARMELVAR